MNLENKHQQPHLNGVGVFIGKNFFCATDKRAFCFHSVI